MTDRMIGRWGLACCLAAGLAAVGRTADADKARPKEEPRTPAGKCVAAAGTLLRRPAAGRDWQAVRTGAVVHTRDTLLALPGIDAAVQAEKGAVRLTLKGAWPVDPEVPVVESAVVLHEARGCDLDLTLERGRVLLANTRTRGAAKVRVRFHDQAWELTLDEPGTTAAVELYGRSLRNPLALGADREGPSDPQTRVFLIVLKGDARLKLPSVQYGLEAPPGRALVSWGSGQGAGPPVRLDKPPAWSGNPPAATAEAKAARAAVGQLRQALEKSAPAAALKELLHGGEPAERALAVYGLGALGDVPALAAALEDPRHPDVRQAAVGALRHWLGEKGINALRLSRVLTAAKFTPGEARLVVQLLHSFSATRLARPEPYALLIDLLTNDRPAIRELAHWHLRRLVPAGNDIAYDAAGSPARREEAQKKWKKLIPDGQLPPRPKVKKPR